ncbi:MAG: hypothetical protein HUJ14_03205, partial [Marinobacter sp.]|nr:hypothetical protein [Marinobacter sp.]
PPVKGVFIKITQFYVLYRTMGLSVGEEHVFLGRELGQPREYSERLAELIDSEVQSKLIELERTTIGFLSEHRRELDALAQAVLDKETLSAEEVQQVLDECEKEIA